MICLAETFWNGIVIGVFSAMGGIFALFVAAENTQRGQGESVTVCKFKKRKVRRQIG